MTEDTRFIWGLLYHQRILFLQIVGANAPLRFSTEPLLRLADHGLSGRPLLHVRIFTLVRMDAIFKTGDSRLFYLLVFPFLQIVGANTPLRDTAPLRLSMFSGLRHLEINGCDLSTAAAKGLLDLKPRLETLTCLDSTVRVVLEVGAWPFLRPFDPGRAPLFWGNSRL
jgi:hypothetical protein